MTDKFTFSSAGQIHELEMAMNRAHGWNAALVKRMCEGDRLVHIREYLLNLAEITYPKAVEPALKVWRTIKLGTGLRTADDFRKAFTASGCCVGDWASDIMSNPAFTVSAEDKELDLVVVSVAELGFKDVAMRDDIYKRAQEFGFDLCPAEVGPQLRLQYKDQPKNEWLLIGMEPIIDSDGDLRVFYVGRGGGGQLLNSGYGDSGHVWGGGNRWVFARRRRTESAS